MREDWEYEIIGKVCKTGAGGTPLKSKKEYYTGGDVPWLLSGEVGQPNILETKNFITKEGLNNSSAKLFPPNTVLVAMYGATAGETGILRIEASTNQAVCGIYPNSKFIPEFLYYCLLVKNKELVDQAQGNAQPNISQKKIKNLEIPIPPLPEQNRIVAMLDEAFEAIDQAKANIERNIDNAEELFQSTLNEIFSQRGEGWEVNKLGKACAISMGQSPKGTTYNDEGIGTPLINGPVEFGPKPFSETVMSKWTTDPKKMCRKGDLILCVRGSTTGRINIAGFDACIGRGVASIRYEKNQKWLNYFIRANQEYIYSLGSGSTFPNVSGKILKKIDFPEPPIELQNNLIEVMEGMVNNTNQILSVYKTKLQNIEELKKSILQKAFSGALTGGESGFTGLKDEQDGLGDVSKAAEPGVEYGG